MRVVVVYRAESDYARRVIDFLHDFNRQTGHTIDDIVEYPTIIALSADSQMQNMWRGLPLPTISEVSFYV